MSDQLPTVAVIGSGSWGTAIVRLLGVKGCSVRLWARDPKLAQAVNETGRNLRHLPDVDLPNTFATSSYEEAMDGAEAAVFVCPSSYLRGIAEQFAPFISPELPCIVLSKGVEADTGYTMIEVLADVLGNESRLACLSGPNHAEEISNELYAATVAASENPDIAVYFQELFSTDYFRVYTASDTTGVELCAASKNVIAIANGVCAALELGDNASASLITRGLAEIARLVEARGGDRRTCAGLAGMGDLIVTCNSRHSRNRSLGEALVAGSTLEEFETKTGMVAEGAVACRTVTDLARKVGVEMPISEVVRRVLWEGVAPSRAAELLLQRPLRMEND